MGSMDRGVRLSRAGFERWLRQRVESRAPAAVVRVGEGELRVLATRADDAKSLAEAGKLIAQQSGRRFSPEEILALRTALERAHDGADVIGALGSGTALPGSWLAARRATWKSQLATLQARRVASGRPAAALASDRLNHEILPELPKLLAGRSVSVVSCRDVKPVLEDMWGVVDVAVYQVPSQGGMRHLDGAYEAAMHDVPIWPEAHDRLTAELSVRESGEVFLIGAGLFGKDLCVRIRRLGGIALDMGSVLDHIAGKMTRGDVQFLMELRANEMPLAEIAVRMRDRFEVEISQEAVAAQIDALSAYL
jgi:hypothetical protein